MKLPLSERPFAPLSLSHEQQDEFERTAMAVLSDTIGEFDHFVHRQNRVMNKKRWKAVKTRENVTVFKKRDLEEVTELAQQHYYQQQSMTRAKAHSIGSGSSHSSGSSTTPSASAIVDWSLPKLLAVGTIVGNLDDVMYGVISPDSDCVKVKTTYVDDELVNGMILCHIRHATEQDPFRFLGLKWFVKAHPTSVNAVVWPRDMVFVEGTGVHVRSNGDKYGYHIMHSVELPQCPALTRLGIVRGTISSCHLFRELPNGKVEVYMKSFVEPAGSLPTAVAVLSAANGLIGCWKSVWCAQNKKLAWLIRDAAATARLRNRGRGHDGGPTLRMKTNAQGKECCAICDHTFSAFRTAVTCELCHTTVCTRCKTARTLTYVYNQRVRKIPTAFCKNCVALANARSSADFARFEYVTPAVEQATTVPTPLTAAQPRGVNYGSVTPSARSRPRLSNVDNQRAAAYATDTEDSSARTAWSIDESVVMRRDSIDVESADTWELQHRTDECLVTPATRELDPQQQLYLQMNQLRLQAEQAYRLTRQNNQVMEEVSSRQREKSARGPHAGTKREI